MNGFLAGLALLAALSIILGTTGLLVRGEVGAGGAQNEEAITRQDQDNEEAITRQDQDAGVRSLEACLLDLLPVLDNLDRAIASAESHSWLDPTTMAMTEGMRMIRRQFLHALDQAGIKAIEAVGHPFDPHVHHAVQEALSSDMAAGTVATVFQRGFTSGGRLLRPALVAVVAGHAGATSAGADR